MNDRASKIDHDIEVSLENLIYTAFSLQIPFAVWQLPEEKESHFITSFSGKQPFNIEKLNKCGFVVHPFDGENNEKFFIPADIYYSLHEGFLKRNSNIKIKEEQVSHFLNALENNDVLQNQNIKNLNVLQQDNDFYEDHFIGNVEKAINNIREDYFQKVVISRTKKISLPENFSISDFYNKLTLYHPGTFKSLIYIPGEGMWMGASPETLASIDKNNVFYTEALAGTQPYNPEYPLKETRWRQKEIEEQAMVSRYIINCFKHIRLREFEEKGPKTVKAGNVLHLKTLFRVNMNEVSMPGLLHDMLPLLHPTSAVCGMPKQNALDFIRQYEDFNRQLYSGFMGPVNLPAERGYKETHLYVNLRCLQILSDSLKLYAGAGITEDSEPEQEWEETNFKMDTLGKLVDTN